MNYPKIKSGPSAKFSLPEDKAGHDASGCDHYHHIPYKATGLFIAHDTADHEHDRKGKGRSIPIVITPNQDITQVKQK